MQSLTDTTPQYQQRCLWCGLKPGRCACDSPKTELHTQCDDCGCWDVADDLIATQNDDSNCRQCYYD